MNLKKGVVPSLEQACISENQSEILKINSLIYFNYKKPSNNSKLK